MDEYYDDEFNEEEYEKPKKEFVTNPLGPYKLEIKFKGIDYDITIENITYKKFKVCAITKDTDDDMEKVEEDIKILEKYLNDEGFYIAARKWNLYYK